jgi:hypothetical protein
MKNAALTLIIALSLVTTAQAGAKTPSKKTISGREAVKEISIGSFLSTKDVFEGDNCSMELKSRGHDLEIIVKENGKLKSTLEFLESETYKMNEKDNGGDSQTTVTSLDGKQSIMIEAADDAFDRVVTEKDGVIVECEMDM